MSNTAQSAASTRIASLLDANSFVEIGGQITARSTDFNLSAKETPSDGVITGYGVIDGSLVYVYSQDATVLNGTVGEMHAKKIARLYDFAMKTGAPVIGLIDCAGMRLQEATDALNGFGEIYMQQTKASGVIPQITGIFGTCGGGMAMIPALTDFTLMEEKKAKLFVNSPNAIEGNEISKCDTSAAEYQAKEAGLVDFKGSEEDVLAQIRALVTMLPANNEDDMSYEECTDDLNRVCKDLANCAGDTSIALSQISDNNVFFEVKADVGFVPTYLKEIGFDTDKVALVCGPPIMIKFVLAGLQEMGFTKEQVYTTLELRMKCGVGKCGRCNIGSKYVCKDGPVFRFDEIDELPNEY